MEHLNDEQLVLHYYGELAESSGAAEGHLGSCAECRARYQTLQRVLSTVDSAPMPEPAVDYEAQVWRRIAPKLTRRKTAGGRSFFGVGSGGWLAPRKLAIGGAMAVVVLAVGDHLERSRVVLVEVANAGERSKGKFDITYEQTAAEDLVESNRIYRQTALRAGDTGTASLLDDLERALLEIAHSPAQMDSRQLSELRHQIEDRGLLFKVKVFQSRVQAKESVPAGGTL